MLCKIFLFVRDLTSSFRNQPFVMSQKVLSDGITWVSLSSRHEDYKNHLESRLYNRNVNIYLIYLTFIWLVTVGNRVNVYGCLCFKIRNWKGGGEKSSADPVLSLTRDLTCVELLCCGINKNTGPAVFLVCASRFQEDVLSRSSDWPGRPQPGNWKSAAHLLTAPLPHLLDFIVRGVSSAVSSSGLGGKRYSAASPWTETRQHFSHISGELPH